MKLAVRPTGGTAPEAPCRAPCNAPASGGGACRRLSPPKERQRRSRKRHSFLSRTRLRGQIEPWIFFCEIAGGKVTVPRLNLECRLYLPERFNLGVRHALRALHRPVPGVGMEDMLRRAKHGILSLLLVWVRAACRCNPANPSRSVLAAMQLGDAANGLRPCLTVGSFEPQHAPFPCPYQLVSLCRSAGPRRALVT